MPRTLQDNEKNVILKNDAQRIASDVYIDNTNDIIYKRYTLNTVEEEMVRIRKITDGSNVRWIADVAFDLWTKRVTATYT